MKIPKGMEKQNRRSKEHKQDPSHVTQ